jgi:hypothetical protein
VFWDGARTIAVELSARETERQKALAAAGVSVCRIEPGMFDRLGEVLPPSLLHFWQGPALPSSPFRRAIPKGVLSL